MDSIKQFTSTILRRYGWLLAVIIAAFLAGYLIAPSGLDRAKAPAIKQPHTEADHNHESKEPTVPTIWTCSMHPQIRLPNPGKCPICFMDLIAAQSDGIGSTDFASSQISLSEAAIRLAQLETSPVIRAFSKFQISMIGMVFEDETRIAALTARVEGRLDEVFVNFTGLRVDKGDPMVKIWSPPLIRSQVDLFETMKGPNPGEDVIRGSEEKLIQLGLTREQIEEIKNNKRPMLNVTLRAPISGIVTKKNAVPGQFVREGTDMFIINDLSRVWVKLDAYESDIPWIRYGQDVTFTASAVPGRSFKGKVLFIDPVLDTKTRSVKVRVEADNQDFLLKPGMFVNARLEAELDSQLRVMKSEWTGKYVCPVHPRDEASSTPGLCPESNMPLKPASAFGYSDDPNPVPPLLIPATAPLITGKRAIVFVQNKDSKTPTYELREVSLGPRTGDTYIVLNGLQEGERVVSKGAFKLDSAMQISAKQSMMNDSARHEQKSPQTPTEEELIERIDVTDHFRNEFNNALKVYFDLVQSLVEEKTDAAREKSQLLGESLGVLSTNSESPKAQGFWNKHSSGLVSNLSRMSQQGDIEGLRRVFEAVSEDFSRLVMAFGHSLGQDVKLYHCSMAFGGRGAYWLELGENKTNPYFGRTPHKGQDMLRCGELQETIRSSSPKSGALDQGRAS